MTLRIEKDVRIEKDFVIDAPVDRIWEILADEFEEVGSWASGLTSSGPNPKAQRLDDGTAGGRVCEIPGFGFTDERVVDYRPDERQLAYSVDAEKIPGFVQNITNRWTLRPHGTAPGSSTHVSMRFSADVFGPLGALMKPMMRRKFDKTLSAAEADLRAYAETGRVSPAKAKELAGHGR